MLLEYTAYAILLFLLVLLFRRGTATSAKSGTKPWDQTPSPTALPIIGHLHHLIGSLHHRTFHNLVAKHGPIYHLRLGPIVKGIVIANGELAKEFLVNHDLDFAVHADNLAVQHLSYGTGFAFSPEGQYWKLSKKLCVSKFLGMHVVSQFLPVRAEERQCFLRVFLTKAKLGEQVNFTKEVTKLTTNVLSRMMMGIRCSGTEEEAGQAYIIHEVAQMYGTANLADAFPIFKLFDVQGIKKKCEDIHKRYDAILEKILIKREELRNNYKEMGKVYDGINGVKDFMDILYDVVEDENAEIRLNRNHIKGLILDFFSAGTDTTAISIEWALAELINNPKILKKAQEEIDHVIGRERLVTELDIPNLPYLQAVIKETLRVHAAIPVFARRTLRDCTVMGYNIPVGTLLFVNLFTINRDPRFWEDPFIFRPERFLNNDATSQRDVKGAHIELLPFGTGRRGCPGINLALRELHTNVAALVQCFEWNVLGNNGVLDMEERGGLSVPRAHDLVFIPLERIDNLDSIINQ